MEFEFKKLGEICTRITDGSHYSPQEAIGGIPMYSVKDMTEFGFSDKSVKRISEEDYEALVKADCTPRVKDVLIAKDGSVLKHVFSIDSEVKGALLSSIAILRPNPKYVESDFLAYALQDPQLRNDVLSNYVSGSGVPRIVLRDFKNISIRTPSLGIQKSIAQALKSLDKKIQVNIALSKTLEEVAQTSLKSWFVDFDPVRAKMQGERPVGMDDATAALFPNSMEDSELGDIPAGWITGTLGDFIEPKKGKGITKSRINPGSVPVVAGGLEPAYFHDTANAKSPVVTVSASGANAGFVRLYLEEIWASDCSFINQDISPHPLFWYLFLKANQERIFHMQQGAAQPHIYPSDLKRLPIPYPTEATVLPLFEDRVSPLFEMKAKLNAQSRSLTEIRDSLLPRLISGELQLPEDLVA